MYRNEQGRLYLRGLFLDLKYEDYAIYTLSDIDKEYKGKVYPSLYLLFMKEADITEYNFSKKYFESYQHWQALCNEEWFKPYIHRWRKELELMIKAEALKEILAQASSEDPKKRLEAAKYIYEKVVSPDLKKGRPSKEVVKEEAIRKAKEEKLISEDWNRLVN